MKHQDQHNPTAVAGQSSTDPVPSSVADGMDSLDSATDIHGAKEADKQTGSPTGKAGKTSDTTGSGQSTPTATRAGNGTGATNVDTQPATPVIRNVSAAKVESTVPEATAGDPEVPGCLTPHSFTGSI